VLSFIPEKSYAVLIGMSTFPKDKENLPPLLSVKAGVIDFQDILVNPEIIGFPRAHVVTMLDDGNASSLAANIAATGQLATDTLLVYYSGHGLIGDKGGLQLATPETNCALVNFTSLSSDAVREAIQKSKAKTKILILDCCFGERAVEIMSAAEDVLSVTTEISGAYAITAASATKTAAAPDGDRYTAFTGHLLELLNDGIDIESKELTLDNIFVCLRDGLNRDGFPEPRQTGGHNVRDFRLAVNRRHSLDILGRLNILESSMKRIEQLVLDNQNDHRRREESAHEVGEGGLERYFGHQVYVTMNVFFASLLESIPGSVCYRSGT
jgi:hypothetical protein